MEFRRSPQAAAADSFPDLELPPGVLHMLGEEQLRLLVDLEESVRKLAIGRHPLQFGSQLQEKPAVSGVVCAGSGRSRTLPDTVRSSLACERVKTVDPRSSDSRVYFVMGHELKRCAHSVTQRSSEDAAADPGLSVFVFHDPFMIVSAWVNRVRSLRNIVKVVIAWTPVKHHVRVQGLPMRNKSPLLGLALWFLALTSAAAQEEITVTTPAGTQHEMVLVPAGEFAMGSDRGRGDEQPVHTVYLDAYYIGKFEVTNAQYVVFLNAIGRNTNSQGNRLVDLRDPDAQIEFSEETFALKSADLADRPVVEVSWYGAKAYCEWVRLRLPTEAEWEKAARGTDGRTYPWGEEIDRARANYGKEGCCRGDDSDGYFWSAPIGSYPDGASPYGAFDMAGNVWEFVMDWYGEDYYARSSARNPPGPDDGLFRVLRGGSMGSDPHRLRTTDRSGLPPAGTYVIIGFRCAGDIENLPPTEIVPESWGRLKKRQR